MQGKLESDHACPGKGSEKTREDLKFTPQTDTRQGDSLQLKQTKKIKKQ